MSHRREIVAVVTLLCLVTSACQGRKVTTTVNPTFDRSRRLSLLAATEAGLIKDPDSRLTRQLNISEQVLTRFGKEDALTVLGDVATTLRETGPSLGSHARISGWVSVSQLSRKAQGPDRAKEAAGQAEVELEALPDLAERCQYVLGVAEELSQLAGDEAGVALLTKGGTWAESISDQAERRTARMAFAVALFNLNAYEGGAATLRGEADPTWSSDMMLALASREAGIDKGTHADSNFAAPVASNAAFGGAPSALPVNQRYGRALSYESIFQGVQNSNAVR